MKIIKDILCHKNCSEQLHDLGLRGKSLFKFDEVGFIRNDVFKTMKNPTNTYTTDELMDMLPKIIKDDDGNKYYFRMDFEPPMDNLGYYNRFKGGYCYYETCEKLPNALARLLIWCIENNHIKVEDLNNK